MTFTPHCPVCYTTNRLHQPECRHKDVHIYDFEKAYLDIIATMIERMSVIEVQAVDLPHDRDWLEESIEEDFGEWTELHELCLEELISQSYIIETSDGLKYLKPEDRQMLAEPAGGDMELVYEYGACDGVLDYGITAIVSWCEMNKFDWDHTREFALEWLDETGTWERGNFEESTPEELVDDKKSYWERGYGWANAAEEVVATMKRRGYIDED